MAPSILRPVRDPDGGHTGAAARPTEVSGSDSGDTEAGQGLGDQLVPAADRQRGRARKLPPPNSAGQPRTQVLGFLIQGSCFRIRSHLGNSFQAPRSRHSRSAHGTSGNSRRLAAEQLLLL